MQTAAAAIARLCDPAAEVSAHYVISRHGAITQLVDESMRAWHAGAGSWGGRGDVNSRSIGIELDHRGTHPFAAPQIDALEEMLHAIMARWDIAAEGIIGHSDMAPGRKSDPGPRFDWRRLERQGLARRRGQGAATGTVTPETFQAAAVAVGYPADVSHEALLEAVRHRYRPGGCGPVSTADIIPLL
ncbi:N-acetylmuramoyl-L-alanine amidase [Sulfitobacter aestuariivivens]